VGDATITEFNADRPRREHPRRPRRVQPDPNRGINVALGQRHDHRLAARIRAGAVVPARITLALDSGDHEGPDVDTACGAVEPAVDMWEAGEEKPTPEQVELLAKLTGFPVAYFYEPVGSGPMGTMHLCGRHCETLRPWVDGRGVLHYGELAASAPRQGALF